MDVAGAGLSARFESDAEVIAARATTVAAEQPAAVYAPYGPPAYPLPPPPPPDPWGPVYPPAPPDPYERAVPARTDPGPAPMADEEPSTPPSYPPAGQAGPVQQPGSQTGYGDGAGGTPPSAPPADLVRSAARARFTAARAAAESAPAATVRLAWAEVERAIDDIADPRFTPPQSPAERAAAPGVTGDVSGMIRDLDRLRDDIGAHPDAVTPATARAYVRRRGDRVRAVPRDRPVP